MNLLGCGVVGVIIVWISLGVHCLRDVRIIVPTAVVRGRHAILRCYYDLEGDPLYALKWYKGGMEFFRYIPTDRPTLKAFPMKGVVANVAASNDTSVYLESVTEDTAGPYSCEISADAPSFFTKLKTSYLNVVDLPTKDPSIDGLKSRYRLGEDIIANCSSGKSKPPANLTWYVNGRKLRESTCGNKTHGRLHSSHCALHLTVTRQLFHHGRLKLRCVARIYDIYHRSFEKSVELLKPTHKHTHRHASDVQHTTDSSVNKADLNVMDDEAYTPGKVQDFALTFRISNGHRRMLGTALFWPLLAVLGAMEVIR